ncbi:uncharacterized protein VTP21DRAFT_10960 [Calcarisporiella thermophila]|uniref:uncharacterized protein n=1 Tax=Calcarisporiella thermophila TaxID=911321 RepID=UPI0037431D1D
MDTNWCIVCEKKLPIAATNSDDALLLYCSAECAHQDAQNTFPTSYSLHSSSSLSTSLSFSPPTCASSYSSPSLSPLKRPVQRLASPPFFSLDPAVAYNPHFRHGGANGLDR